MPPTDEPPASKGRAPHRRNEEARLAVLHAADDLLAERGFGGVTIEGIAKRAGVAKQTIYRWWPSKVDILLDTLVEDAARQLVIADKGPMVDGVRRYARAYARMLTKDDAGKVLLALLGEAQHDAATARLLAARFLDPQRARERALLERGRAAGELVEDVDADAVLDAVLGPIVFRALTGARIPQGFVDRVVDDALRVPPA
jgi:AcrR family transcriptional regulator